MKDAVEDFMKMLGNPADNQFIQDGIASIQFPDAEIVAIDFRKLVTEINEGNNPVYVRAYGRGNTTGKRDELNAFLKTVLGKDVVADATNNTNPKKRFYKYSGFNKKDFKNYKLSHVWDKISKNPYAFCALWNMCLTPFYLDPFTGHEVEHKLAKAFQAELRKKVFSKYENTISEYNIIMKDLESKITICLADKNYLIGFTESEKLDIQVNFKQINLEDSNTL